MNKKAFTLVELLGTIILLSIIALIALPSVLSLLTSSQKEINESYKSAVINAARNYVNDNMDLYPKALEGAEKKDNGNITVKNLLDNGYITDSSINEINTCEMMNDYIKITSDFKKYSFEYVEVSDEGVCES